MNDEPRENEQRENEPREHVELIALIELVLVDRATSRDVDRLDTLLAGSQSARSVYLSYVDLHACLKRKYAYPGTDSAEFDAVVNATPRSLDAGGADGRSRWNRAAMVWTAVAASLLFVVLLQRPEAIGFAAWGQARPAGEQADVGGVAVLSKALDAQWSRGSRAASEGSVIPAGELAIDGGVIQLDFFDGAVVVVEGPARLELKSSMAVDLQRGKLRARVPTRAIGFRVGTPLGEVLDLGTEFALRVDEQGRLGELHVIEGKVQFTPESESSAPPRKLRANEGVQLSFTGISPIESDKKKLARRFVGPTEIESLDRLRQSERYADWLDWREDMLADPALLAYYGYSQDARWSRTLRNFAPDGADESHGVVVGCEWVQGRWPGHKAVGFRNASHRVSLNVPGEHKSLTLAAWVLVDRLAASRAVTLIHSERQTPGCLSWALEGTPDKRGGALSQFLSMRVPEDPERTPTINNYDSMAWVLRPQDYRVWVHMAITYDAQKKRVIHYRNGEVVHAIKIASPQPQMIGRADLGNWPLSERGQFSKSSPRNLLGSLDELIVVDRAMSAGELSRLYRIGAP